MKPSPEYVMKITERVIRAKQELAAAQLEWDRLFAGNGQLEMSLKDKSSDGESNRARIISLLELSPLKTFDAKHIAALFNIHIGTTRTTLSKLVKAGLVEKRGFGAYGAKGALDVPNGKEVIPAETTP